MKTPMWIMQLGHRERDGRNYWRIFRDDGLEMGHREQDVLALGAALNALPADPESALPTTPPLASPSAQGDAVTILRGLIDQWADHPSRLGERMRRRARNAVIEECIAALSADTAPLAPPPPLPALRAQEGAMAARDYVLIDRPLPPTEADVLASLRSVLAPLRGLAEKATPAPWICEKAVCFTHHKETRAIYHKRVSNKTVEYVEVVESPDECCDESIKGAADHRLIVALRNALPALLKCETRAETRTAALREALEAAIEQERPREVMSTVVGDMRNMCSVCRGYWPDEHRPGCWYVKARAALSAGTEAKPTPDPAPDARGGSQGE